jgi:hypothetical protein
MRFVVSIRMSYVLVHQARLANPAVTEDNDLPPLAPDNRSLRKLLYLEQDLLPGGHGVAGIVGCGRRARCDR